MLRSVLLTSLAAAGALIVSCSAVASQTPEQAARAVHEQFMKDSREGRGAYAGMADENMSAEWRAVHKALGAEESAPLYIFITMDMPIGMLRAYALDAARAGGTLVLRGIPEGYDLKSFVTEHLLGVLGTSGMTAPIQIDPRLFDAYDIEVAPTIVLASKTANTVCQSYVDDTAQFDGAEYELQRCPSQDEGSYHSVAGAVETQWALEHFADQGSEDAQSYLDAIASSYYEVESDVTGESDAREDDDRSQQPLGADAWSEIAEKIAERNAEVLRERHGDEDREVVDTPLGPAVSPPASSNPDQ